MARISLVKGGQIRAGGKDRDGNNYGAGTFISNDGETTKKLGTKGVKDTAKGIVSQYQEQFEPTTITDTTIREDVIPELNSKIDKYAETGQYQDNLGNRRNADGTIVDDQFDDPYSSSEVTAIDDQADSLFSEQMNLLKSLQSQTDADTARQLSAIERQMNVRESSLKEINRRNEAATDTALLLGGSSRYTTSGDDIAAAQVRSGIMELAELDALEQSMIAQVKSAQAEKNFSLASQKMELLEQKRQEKVAKATALAESMAEANNELRERQRKQANDFAIVEKIQAGVTNPMDIFAELDGEVPFDEVLAFTNELPKEEAEQDTKPFTLGSMDIRYDAQGNVIAKGAKVSGGVGLAGEVNLGGTGVGGSTVGTTGERFPTDADINNMTTEQRDFVNKVMRQLPTKLKDSELEKKERMKEALFDFNRGRGIQEVVDEMNGFIIQGDKNKQFGTVLRRLATGTDLELADISAAINNGDKAKAMSIVENANLEKAEGELADVTDSQAIVSNANRVLALLEDAPTDKLGAFDGRKFKVGRFTGMTDEDTLKTQQLETALVNLLNEIRRKSLGTAVTESEVQFLSPLLSDVLDQPEIIKSKMDELKVGTINVHNRARSVVNLPEVTESELLNNKERVKLYEGLAGVTSEVQKSSQNNTDFLNSGAWGGTVSEDITSLEDDEFFNKY